MPGRDVRRRGVAFPTRDKALAKVGRAVRDVLARGDAPVVLVNPVAIAVDIGAALAADRIGLAAHRSIVQAAMAYRHAGLTRRPLQRFAASSAGRGAAVARAGPRTARRAGAREPGLILVSADAGSAAPAAQGGAGSGRVTFPTAADFAGLIRYVEASGATEVALVNAPERCARGRVARPGNRRVHARTAATNRAFRRLSWPARLRVWAPSPARACVGNFQSCSTSGWAKSPVILLLALIFIGPKKLPELASGLGIMIRQIRKTTADVKNEIVLDDTFRRPFEELRDAVTLAPEELKRIATR